MSLSVCVHFIVYLLLLVWWVAASPGKLLQFSFPLLLFLKTRSHNPSFIAGAGSAIKVNIKFKVSRAG